MPSRTPPATAGLAGVGLAKVDLSGFGLSGSPASSRRTSRPRRAAPSGHANPIPLQLNVPAHSIFSSYEGFAEIVPRGRVSLPAAVRRGKNKSRIATVTFSAPAHLTIVARKSAARKSETRRDACAPPLLYEAASSPFCSPSPWLPVVARRHGGPSPPQPAMLPWRNRRASRRRSSPEAASGALSRSSSASKECWRRWPVIPAARPKRPPTTK